MLIDPDEIFLDTYNLPDFDRQQFEGELEKPISKPVFYFVGGIFCFLGVIFLIKIFNLQIINGPVLASRSANNTLRQTPVFSERGVIYDRQGRELVRNDPERTYPLTTGSSHLLGYIGYPTKEELTIYDYNPRELVGRDGAEKVYNQSLRGRAGIKIEEVDAHGVIQSDYFLELPRPGESLYLSIDARVQEKLFDLIKSLAAERGFVGGAGVILDTSSGELLALTSYPEYDSQILSSGDDQAAVNRWSDDSAAAPFLNRAIDGLYAPGSVIKPIIAVGVLNEGVIDPAKELISTGALTLPNPFDPSKPSIFRDWKAHGAVDLRRALAVSSDVYFYEVGGGFEDQPGLGIKRIDQYARLFGLGAPTGINWVGEASGVIPTPEWKERFFPGDPWRIGNTYHTAIGQYGFQVTPLQMARAVAAIANDGFLVTPTALAASSTPVAIKPRPLSPLIKSENLAIVREGMRLAVLKGTAAGLNMPETAVAAKTGTAELGTAKAIVNSWVVGFFPYEAPRYSFAVVMERGRSENTIGGVFVMRQLFDWLTANAPEYLQPK